MITNEKVIAERKKAAELIRRCLKTGFVVREALKLWPNDSDDVSVSCAKYALIHYVSDEDIRRQDSLYAEQQDEWLETIVNILSKGEPMPLNIIKSYEEYYEIPVSFHQRVINAISGFIYQVKHIFFEKL